jgi:hypothetical protein
MGGRPPLFIRLFYLGRHQAAGTQQEESFPSGVLNSVDSTAGVTTAESSTFRRSVQVVGRCLFDNLERLARMQPTTSLYGVFRRVENTGVAAMPA